MRVGVCGAGGRMGATVCRTVAADLDLELVAAVDPRAAGDNVEGVPIARELKAFADTAADVVVDFTVADAARTTVPWLAMHGIHAVVGTTGLTADDLALFAQEFGKGGPNCVVAPNFSISAVVMMHCAGIAAPFFDTAEIVELHHDGKADAPSGTAIATAERMAAASDQWAPDPTRTEVLAGARGGTGAAGIRIHAVRMRGMVAHQEVILGARGQSLTIRQDSYDRESFMPGVILACKKVAEQDGLVVGLEKLLGL
jgi:4-hydroxy-tetrahydrodipicolinate reductase